MPGRGVPTFGNKRPSVQKIFPMLEQPRPVVAAVEMARRPSPAAIPRKQLRPAASRRLPVMPVWAERLASSGAAAFGRMTENVAPGLMPAAAAGPALATVAKASRETEILDRRPVRIDRGIAEREVDERLAPHVQVLLGPQQRG